MDPRYWTSSVSLWIGSTGRTEKVRSTRDAIDCLSRWPSTKRNAAYIHAVEVCQATMLSDKPRVMAREAFILAAEEAGIYIRPIRRRRRNPSNA